MAQKATKARAKSNVESLKNLHLCSLCINVLFLLWHFFFKSRSLLTYFLLSIPAFLCEYALERAGRPKYHPQTGALVSAGDDLKNAGLTEYMFDCVWITWAALTLVMLFGNWMWLLWSVVPAFALYKGSALLSMARGMMGMGGSGGMPQGMEGMPQDQPAQGGNRKQRRKA
ncbi:hypothetical protein MKZ38_007282 [Zalerion maritima]|uniref:DUF788 domain-containing protein n=1 Tax=Zalerion maritima TaxID=339359 RepID=A0AAD5WN06_9PEZI|nr:hypothetical protein MKZ38_007282 [Zalerion maritima]